MIYQSLVDKQILYTHLNNPDWVIVDCRFDLADTAAGERAYREGHIPGAVYAHLDQDLSGPPITDQGRHPLPAPEAMIHLFSRLGVDGRKQVVAYDSAGGALAAARLWWMLRYMGHRAAAVLDGGWQTWLEAGLPITAGPENKSPSQFQGTPHHEWLILRDDVARARLLVDSRDPLRYQGEVEPIDPVAGHIPGAVNYPLNHNLAPDGCFLPASQIREQMRELLGNTPANEAVFYCGSGVSACLNLLALVHAGLPDGRLYAGSWSDWIHDYQ